MNRAARNSLITLFWMILCLVIFAGPIPESEAAPRRAVQDTATLIASADAFIADKAPSSRFGSENVLRFGYDATLGYQQSLVQFQLSDGLPRGAFVDEALIELYVNAAAPSFDPPLATTLYRVDAPWSEALVSWGNRPAVGPVQASIGVGRDPNFYQWNVTGLVRDWASGARPNHGVLFIADASPLSVRSRVLNSREASRFQPRLVIRFTPDVTAPVASVSPLPQFSPVNFTVSWSGTDVGSGIESYDIQVRANGGAWQDWQVKTTTTSALFTGQPGSFYEFRARALDRAGNWQLYGGTQASTTAGMATARVLPFPAGITSNPTFTVNWTGNTNGGSAIKRYFIYVSYNGGPFSVIPSMNGVTTTSGSYTAVNGDGNYRFQATAENNDGVVEPLGPVGEAAILLDAQPPFLTQRIWLTFVGAP